MVKRRLVDIGGSGVAMDSRVEAGAPAWGGSGMNYYFIMVYQPFGLECHAPYARSTLNPFLPL